MVILIFCNAWKHIVLTSIWVAASRSKSKFDLFRCRTLILRGNRWSSIKFGVRLIFQHLAEITDFSQHVLWQLNNSHVCDGNVISQRDGRTYVRTNSVNHVYDLRDVVKNRLAFWRAKSWSTRCAVHLGCAGILVVSIRALLKLVGCFCLPLCVGLEQFWDTFCTLTANRDSILPQELL